MRQYPKLCSLLQDQPCLLGVLSGTMKMTGKMALEIFTKTGIPGCSFPKSRA